MKHRLTHELLTYLKAKGYTMLVGIGQAGMKDYVFTPVEQDFSTNSNSVTYRNHAFHFIDDLLKLDLKNLFMQRVVLPEETPKKKEPLSTKI